jgi:hypothetical protein
LRDRIVVLRMRTPAQLVGLSDRLANAGAHRHLCHASLEGSRRAWLRVEGGHVPET